jgi:hypothetical protein
VDRIESDNEKLVLYFSKLTATEVCVTVTMRPEQMVTNVQRALIQLYRYYDKTSIARTFYQLPTNGKTSKDYCDTCPQCCQAQKSKN